MKSLIKIYCFSLLILIVACSSDSKDNTSSKPLTDKKNVSDDWSGEDKQRAVDSCVQSGNIEKFCDFEDFSCAQQIWILGIPRKKSLCSQLKKVDLTQDCVRSDFGGPKIFWRAAGAPEFFSRFEAVLPL